MKTTPPVPALSVLTFSGGQQSSALLWMILRKEFVPDSPFIVLNADPGMENEQTYQYVERMRGLCQAQGIEFITAAGPNLFSDLVELDQTDATRFDLPPYWTRNRTTGKRGRLMQACTAAYKIAPMDRAIRRKLRDLYGSNVSGRLPGSITVSYTHLEYIPPPSTGFQGNSIIAQFCRLYPLPDLSLIHI